MNSDDPVGPKDYLGLGSRLVKGPSGLMTGLGFRAENAQAEFLHDALGQVDLAHVLALAEVGALPPPLLERLVRALLELRETPARIAGYDPRDGDAYNSRERMLRDRLGANAGWLSYGRTRREAGRQAFGLACRTALVARHRDLSAFVAVLAERARAHRRSWWADQTYWLPAQISTLGHYLLSLAFEAARNLDRIETVHARCGLVPLAAGGAAGTRVPIEPALYRKRLGLTEPTTTTRDAMWAVDGLLDLAVTAEHLALTATRLAEDLMVYVSDPFSWVRLDDSHVRSSVHLPQKRNPYALTAIRGTHAIVSGRLGGLITSLHTGSAQTDNWIFNYAEVFESLDLAGRSVTLATEVIGSATFDTDRLAATARDGFADAADRAEMLVAEQGVDYRTAHEQIARQVAGAEASGRRRLPESGDLESLVQRRRGAGGAATADMDDALQRLSGELERHRRWQVRTVATAQRAEQRLLAEARCAAKSDSPPSAEPAANHIPTEER